MSEQAMEEALGKVIGTILLPFVVPLVFFAAVMVRSTTMFWLYTWYAPNGLPAIGFWQMAGISMFLAIFRQKVDPNYINKKTGEKWTADYSGWTQMALPHIACGLCLLTGWIIHFWA